MGSRELAVAFLDALDAGGAPRELREQLADVALELGEDLVRLASEVKAGGRHAWRRAIDLAEVLYRLDAEGHVAPVGPAALLLRDGADP